MSLRFVPGEPMASRQRSNGGLEYAELTLGADQAEFHWNKLIMGLKECIPTLQVITYL